MHVQIPQPGQHGHAFGGDRLVPGRHRHGGERADAFDAIAADQDHAVADRRRAGAVDERASHERDRIRGHLPAHARAKPAGQREYTEHPCDSNPLLHL